MNQPAPSVGLTVAGYAGRVLVTLLAVFIFLIAFGLVEHAHQSLVSAQAGLKNLPSVYLNKPAANLGRPSVQPLWPEFPHSDPGNFQTLVVNGIQVMTERWDCGNSPDEVLSYYCEQMAARGWQDVTEKTYNLQPESQGTAASLQKKDFVNAYRQIMSSTLVLSRGDWSMRVTTEPSKNGFHQITVKLFAAATPEMKALSRQMISSLDYKRGGQPLDVVQDGATEHYHTTIATENESAEAAFQEKYSALSALGWKPVIFLPKKQTANGYFVWLVRGKQYGALAVSVLAQGQGSSVTFTEVTPN